MSRRHTSQETEEAIRLALTAYPVEPYASLARKLDVDDSTVRRVAVDAGLEGFRGFENTEQRQRARSLVPGAGTLPPKRHQDGEESNQEQLDLGL